jgi:predicted nucleic acid-binding protein
MIALDSNILIYAHRSGVLEHRAAMRAIEDVAGRAGGWGVAFPCIAEFWAVVTHPASSGRPSRPREAESFLDNLVAAGAKILYPRTGAMARLSKLAVRLDVRGPRIFDLQIGLTCQEAGAREIWSHDHNFIGVPGLVVNDPLD